MSSKVLKFSSIARIYICYKVTKEDVYNSCPDTALCYLKFQATLKSKQENISDLELTFNGMRDEKTVTIPSYDLQLIKSHNGIPNDLLCWLSIYYDNTFSFLIR